MPVPRLSDEDARLQRLADLSIEIRMLKARVRWVLDEGVRADSPGPVRDTVALQTVLNGARCPHCGHPAGLALLPTEYQLLSTPVRCFGCRRDSAAFDWVGAPTLAPTHKPSHVARANKSAP